MMPRMEHTKGTGPTGKLKQWVCKVCGSQANKDKHTETGYCPKCQRYVQLMMHDPNKQLYSYDRLSQDLNDVKEELTHVLSEFAKHMRQLQELEGMATQLNHLEDRIEEINKRMVHSLNEIRIT